MPCDGRNDNCRRRRELLSQLKCIIDSMSRKKPCEWDQPPASPPISICPDVPPKQDSIQHQKLLKRTNSVFLRGSVMHKCICIKRNGLQDRCMMWDCMGKPECTTKLYPTCEPGQKALSKFMKRGDVDAALDKFVAADKARESALANYCKLIGSKVNNDGNKQSPPRFSTPSSSQDLKIQPRHQKMFNSPQHQKLQHNYPPMQRTQPLLQEPILQQPMTYSYAPEQQHQNHHHFHPQNFGYSTSFMNNQPVYPLHQVHPMNQQYQFQIPFQFVQQHPHSPPPNLPYVQNNSLPC